MACTSTSRTGCTTSRRGGRSSRAVRRTRPPARARAKWDRHRSNAEPSSMPPTRQARRPAALRRACAGGGHRMRLSYDVCLSKRRRRRKDDAQALVALGEVDAQRGGHRTVEEEAETVILLEAIQIQVGASSDDLARVIEHGGVEEAVDHHAPLRLQQQAVVVSEAPAGESAQR